MSSPNAAGATRTSDRSHTDLHDSWRDALAGDPQALVTLLRHALQMEPDTPEGRATRRAVSRAYRRRARRSMVRAKTIGGAAATALRREAKENFLLAALAANGVRVAPSSSRTRSVPAPDPNPQPSTHHSAIDPAPDAPSGVSASVSSPTSALVSWIKPNDHGLPITQYVVTRHDKTANMATPGLPLLPTATSTTVTGLTTGNRYTFTVKATNLDGTGSDSLESNEVIPGGATVTPSVPQNVVATGAGNTVTVSWTAPATGTAITTYVVTPRDGAGNPVATPAQTVLGATTTAVFPGLPNGTYTFRVKANNAGGFGPEAVSPPVTVNLGALTDFHPTLPPLSSELLLKFAEGDLKALDSRSLLTEPIAMAAKWRYEYLKAEAAKAAGDALQYERLIAQLMEMALTKVSTAELLLNPILASAITTLQNDSQTLGNLAQRADVQDISSQLADVAAQALLLQAIITWLIENDPIQFWVGLFGKMIHDVAAFDGGLSRTNAYLDSQFVAGPVGAAVKAAAQDLILKSQDEVNRMAAPLRAAVAEIIGGASQAMDTVFRNYDGPLLMVHSLPGQPDVPNVNPLANQLAGLEQAVEGLVEKIQQDIKSKLQAVVGGTADLFKKIMIAFIVLPILAFLVVAAAGGPFSAAILAAIVLIAAEALIHLLARWLSGPLLGKLAELKSKVLDTVRQFEQLFAQEAALLDSPQDTINLLAGELLELRNLLPEAFLDDAASLLGRARDAVMRSAIDLALAAEQALGMENATAFDTISYDYETGLTPSSQLPGGADASRLSGAALLADLDRLERCRTSIRDGKELEITHRLSLSRLLGGVRNVTTGVLTNPGQFATFLTNGQAVVHLSEAALLDRPFPGVYRALIKEVRVAGVFAAPIAGLSAFGVPVTVTHLGESRTRIKRDANPASPPTSIVLPECLAGSAQQFATKLLNATELARMIQSAFDATAEGLPQGTQAQVTWLRDYRFSIGVRFKDAFLTALPAGIATRTALVGCGLVDSTGIRAAAYAVIDGLNWFSLPEVQTSSLLGFFTILTWPTVSDIQAAVTALGIATALSAGLNQAAIDAYQLTRDQARRPLNDSVGKWGEVALVEDPDPQVRSLGFATLVRSARPESAVFNLFRADQALPAQNATSPPSGFDGLAPVTPATTLQYRPFENRGLEGDLMISFEPSNLAGSLIDLVLEVTFRACYDSDLAATVKASRSQRSAGETLAQAVAAQNGRTLIFPGAIPDLLDGATALRTVHFSLRAHRDKLLLASLAAAEAAVGVSDPSALGVSVTVDGVTFDPQIKPLRRDAAFSSFATAPFNSITLQLKQSANRPTSLAGLLGLVPVTPDDLGFPPSVLTSPEARLVGVGVAVIPASSTLAIQGATIDAPLSTLIPAFGAPEFGADTTLVMTTTQNAVDFARVWTAEPRLVLDLGNAVANNELYDVIFSLSVRVPIKATQTALSTIA